uniref:2-Hacid_dh_C domain-containing protein n=1 Tax=Angiostrongylus cantonensis TaxID=6313 RepID=A0A0K0D147_ANGCA
MRCKQGKCLFESRGDDLRNASDRQISGVERTILAKSADLKIQYSAHWALSSTSDDTDLHALLEAAGHTKLYAMAIHETKTEKPDVGQLNDEILVIVTSYEILSLHLAILRLQHTCQKKVGVINCYSPTCPADESKLNTFKLEEVTRSKKSFKLGFCNFNAGL